MNIKSKRIIASIFAITLCVTPTFAQNVGFISNNAIVSSITASAAESADSNWEFTISNGTAIITKYAGTATRVYVPEAVKDKKTQKSYTVTAVNGAFKRNKTITYVAFPRGVTEIGKDTFFGASNLSEAVLPDSVKKIGESAFDGTKLTKITLPYSLEEIGNWAFSGTKITSVTCKNNLKLIGNYAFYNTPLASITLNNNLKTIGPDAFRSTKLSTITIPASVTSFGARVFYDCDNLTNINMTEAALDRVLSCNFLIGCKNLSKINNTQVVCKDAVLDGKPYFNIQFEYYIKKYFANCDRNGISFMNQYIDAYTDYVVRTETAGCKTAEEKVRKLHDWVCDKVDYAYQSNGKPEESDECHCDASVFLRRTTVCEGYARALTLLLRKAGFEAYYTHTPRYLNGKFNDNPHAWTIVKLGNNYYHIDACHDDGKGKGNRNYDHYLVSETDLQKCCGSHKEWEIINPSNPSQNSSGVIGDRYNYTVPTTKPVCKYTWGK